MTDSAAVRTAVRQHRPDVVVNCAAWTAVDDAEHCEDQALLINGNGAANLAAACEPAGIRLVQMSTDYVFDGRARKPYREADPPAPRTAYGRTKLAGERAVLDLLPDRGYVVRTAWLYGVHGPNFVRTMIRLERQRPYVDVVDDQYGQPTWTVDVADRIIELIRADARPASTTRRAPARRRGMRLLARCSGCLAPIRHGCGRPRPPRWRVRRPGPLIAYSGTPPGPGSG